MERNGKHRWAILMVTWCTEETARQVAEQGLEEQPFAEGYYVGGPSCVNCGSMWSQGLAEGPCPPPHVPRPGSRTRTRVELGHLHSGPSSGRIAES